MAVIISGNGIDMGNNPVSNASQIDGVVINENGESVATTAFATSQDLGVAQTWQDVTTSRSLGVTYTNTTGKPIEIIIQIDNSNSNAGIYLIIDGSTRSVQFAPTIGYTARTQVSAIIPNGSTYSADVGPIGGTLTIWSELR